MLVVFAHELVPDKYTTEDSINQWIDGFPAMPTSVMDAIENLNMVKPEILQEMEIGKGYGDLDRRSVYFAWEVPFAPSIGWMFNPPVALGLDSLSKVTDIYFGQGDTLLCDYE